MTGERLATADTNRAVVVRYLVLCGADRFGDTLRYSGLTIIAAVSYRELWLLTALSLARFLPWLIIGPAAGALADLFGNRRVAVLANGVKALATLALCFCIIMQASSVLLVTAAAAASLSGVVLDAATSSWLPRLVGSEEITRTNGTLSSVQSTCALVAPAVAGFSAVAQNGLWLSLALATAVAVAAVEARRLPVHRGTLSGSIRSTEVIRRSFREGMDGLLALGRHRRLRSLTAAIQLLNIAGGFQLVAFPLLVVALGESGAVLGALLTVQAVGMVIGNLACGRWDRVLFRERPGVVMTLACLMQVAVFAGLGSVFVLGAPIWLAGALMLILGISSGSWNVASTSYLMRVLDPRSLGVSLASYRTAAMIAAPVGSAIAGVVLDPGNHAGLVYAFPAVLSAIAATVLQLTSRAWKTGTGAS